MIRLFDIAISLLALVFGSPALAVIFVFGLLDTGSPLYFQKRVGRHQKPFTLVKFRTMRIGTPSIATHNAPADAVTRFGAILRRTKIDELPQLWNVLVGDMSLVGPRPNLFSQTELINAREERGVYSVRPGITGLAQINHVDMSTPQILANIDAKMIEEHSLQCYFSIIVQTALGSGTGGRIRADG
jgi:lipopolysaccharide/colanic/teichoic acid biosynthesis glycosyltransferase